MSQDQTQNLVLERLAQVLDRVGAIETQLSSIDTRLKALEDKALDTKPIWERALAELVTVNLRLDGLDRRFSVLNDDVLSVRADQRKHEERLSDLEHPRS